MTSIKKRDNMLAVVGPSNTPGPLITGTGFTSLYMPSARGFSPTTVGEAGRSRQQIFAVGYKERVQIDILGGGIWKWRRLVFTFKGSALWNQQPTWTNPFHNQGPVEPQATRMSRYIAQPATDQLAYIRSVLWDGTEGVDWSTEFTAKVDTSQITPMYDKVTTFNPRNESGFSRTFNLWHPIRRNIVYGDDESGGSDVTYGGSYVSVEGKPGVGDVYVYDIAYLAVPAAGGNASMNFNPEGTFYWHER